MFKMKETAFSTESKVFDYIGAYEKAIRDLIAACGSKEAANVMLDELHQHYESTYSRLQQLDRELGEAHPMHPVRKRAILARANGEVHGIIERHVPHTSDNIRELIIGASLAATAITMPVSSALGPLAVATSIVAIGSSYYIGFKILSNWKLIAGKHRVAHLAGVVGPKHVKGLVSGTARAKAKAGTFSGRGAKKGAKAGGPRGLSGWLRRKKD